MLIALLFLCASMLYAAPVNENTPQLEEAADSVSFRFNPPLDRSLWYETTVTTIQKIGQDTKTRKLYSLMEVVYTQDSTGYRVTFRSDSTTLRQNDSLVVLPMAEILPLIKSVIITDSVGMMKDIVAEMDSAKVIEKFDAIDPMFTKLVSSPMLQQSLREQTEGEWALNVETFTGQTYPVGVGAIMEDTTTVAGITYVMQTMIMVDTVMQCREDDQRDCVRILYGSSNEDVDAVKEAMHKLFGELEQADSTFAHVDSLFQTVSDFSLLDSRWFLIDPATMLIYEESSETETIMKSEDDTQPEIWKLEEKHQRLLFDKP